MGIGEVCGEGWSRDDLRWATSAALGVRTVTLQGRGMGFMIHVFNFKGWCWGGESRVGHECF